MENSRFDESNKYQNLKDQKTYNLLDLKKRTKFLKLEEEEFLYMKDELPMYEIIEEKRERLHSDQFEDSIDFHHYFEKTITVDNLQLEQYWKNKLYKYNINYDELYNLFFQYCSNCKLSTVIVFSK